MAEENHHVNEETAETAFNVWDRSVPVEKSSYLVESPEYLNYEHLTAPEPGTYTMLDLFCGAGGFSVGCGLAGFRPVLGIDHFRPAMETWLCNHPHSLGCLGDIRTVAPETMKKLLHEKGINKIHLLTGGVPCQGFSIANRKHNDQDERNFLFREYIKYVDVFQPDYIILENVSGLRATAGGKFEKEIIQRMETLGYTATVRLLNAADFGVPQTRQRLVFVGIRRGRGLAGQFTFPEGGYSDTDPNKKPYRTVYDAISDLPALGSNERAEEYTQPPLTDYQRLLRGENQLLGIRPPVRLANHVAPAHPEETIRMISSTKPGEPMYEKFRQRIRLRLDQPSPTQLAGGIRPQFQFGHPTQPRGLTIRERARIQSFPDSYVFKGGTVQERVQTGNAVPPLMVYAIAKEIAKDLDQKYHANDCLGGDVMPKNGCFDIYYDSLTEASWFASLNPAFDLGRNRYHIIGRRGSNSELIEQITEYDRPDIILVKDGVPLLVIEMTQEVPSGHNVGQRFARLVRAVELGIPTIYFFPFDAMKHGMHANICHMNIRLLAAARRMFELHGTPLLCVNWPSDQYGEVIVDGSEDNEIKALLASYVGSGFDPSCSGITRHLKSMQSEYRRRLHICPSYGKFPRSVQRLSTSDLSRIYGIQDMPSSFADRPFTYVYCMNMTPDKCKRQDPYTGTAFIYDYIACRNGPSVNEKTNNLVLYFPNLTLETWMSKNPNDPTTKSCNWYLTANLMVFKNGWLWIRG